MATLSRPPRPPAESCAAKVKPPDLRRPPGPHSEPVSVRRSATSKRQAGSSQVGDPHTLQTAEDVTSQEARVRWHHNHARLRPPPEPRNPQMAKRTL
jgi:hypothetical protein